MIVAFPSEQPGGLDADLSDHFGHCDLFTLIDQDSGKVRVVPNVPHGSGGCLAVINYLADHKVQALVVGGMGLRPLEGCQAMDIATFHHGGATRVADAAAAFVAGRLPRFGLDQTCGGGQSH